MTRIQWSDDHRLREIVRSTGDIGHATQRGVPRSSARGWPGAARADVVTLDIVDRDSLELQRELLAPGKRAERLVASLRLLVVLLKVSGFSPANSRLPDGDGKVSLPMRSPGKTEARNSSLRAQRDLARRHHCQPVSRWCPRGPSCSDRQLFVPHTRVESGRYVPAEYDGRSPGQLWSPRTNSRADGSLVLQLAQANRGGERSSTSGST